MSDKVYYYLKLEQDYFNNKATKTMRKLPSGAEMTIVYLKMQLRYLSSNGTITYDGMLPSIEEEIALEIDEEPNVVKLTLNALLKWGLVEMVSDNELYMLECQSRVGTKTDSALRVAKHREKQKLLQCNTDVTKSNAILDIELELEKDIDIDKDNKKPKRFKKPTLEEVKAYIQEHNYSVNAEKFINYYESNGWKVGKNSMKDWKATVRTWNTNNFNNTNTPTNETHKTKSAEDYKAGVTNW